MFKMIAVIVNAGISGLNFAFFAERGGLVVGGMNLSLGTGVFCAIIALALAMEK